MNAYVTANTIKALREKKELTQSDLAERLSVSAKLQLKKQTFQSKKKASSFDEASVL